MSARRRVAVLRTGLSNVDSVLRAIEEVGGAAYVVEDPGDLGTPDRLVLPGVGAFAAGAEALESTGLGDAVVERVRVDGTPLLGICLGMQLLADHGDEGGPARGLGLIPGVVRRLEPTDPTERVPHVGWNQVHAVTGCALFTGLDPDADYYFVHSYHVVPEDSSASWADTPYCGGFSSVVGAGPVVGVQFHPEKSHQAGLGLLRNFLEGPPC